MRFAYADPPYLGQGKRYAHLHPDALIWDDPATHAALVKRLEVEYPDGWAVSLAAAPASVAAYAGEGRELAVWVRTGNSEGPPQRRINQCFELVIYRTTVPNSKAHGPCVNNYLLRGRPNPQRYQQTHTGTKPPEFCHWVLDLLGYDPEGDEVDDLFPGEGSMTRATAQHRLDLWDPADRKNRGRRKGWRPTHDSLPL